MAGNTNTLGFGGGATTSIVNAYSSGGTNSGANIIGAGSGGGKEVLSGALTANTLATALSVSGVGSIPWLAVHTKDATARTVRIKVTVDGVVAFDATSSSISSTGHGMVVAGNMVSSTSTAHAGSPVAFNSSLLVEVASSLTETDKVSISYVLDKRS